MLVYRTLLLQLIRNYFIGASVAVLEIGSVLVVTTLDISRDEVIKLITVLICSLCFMFISEGLAFRRHLRPLRIFYTVKDSQDEWTALEQAYVRTYRLPTLSVYRIIGPHFLGFTIPALGITWWMIKSGMVSIPFYYLILGTVGSVLIAGMHAFVEFFLTKFSIKPVLNHLREAAAGYCGRELPVQPKRIISIRRKFWWGAFLIGVFPLFIFSLAIQIRLESMSSFSPKEYWSFAAFILCIGIVFAYFGGWLLTRDIGHPIDQLREVMAQVKEGNMSAQAVDLYSDEFSGVIAGFNHMIVGLRERELRNNQLLDSYFATLSAALDARDPYTAGHSMRVAEYSVYIGKLANLNDTQINILHKTALLHDIGKIGISDSVLLKPGQLTDDEFDQIKAHPILGESILQQIEPTDAVAPMLPGVRSHHERYDGSGYPDRLSGEDIPMFGRIIAVADAFDAMVSDRPYRKGMDPEKAISILERGRGTQWDPYFAGLFVQEYHKIKKPNVS